MNVGTLLLTIIGIILLSKSDATTYEEECIKGRSTLYNGTRSVTASGRTCQRWDETFPHKPKHIPLDGGKHNYCRNPDKGLLGTWCYTMEPNRRWEACQIPKCPDDALVIWTNYDTDGDTASLLKTSADPEVVKLQTNATGSFNISIVFSTNRSNTEFWALVANYEDKALYFTNYKQEYLSKWDMITESEERYLEGMMHGIENIAYDPISGNFYFTDSNFGWVMATDSSFKYYKPVYKTTPDPPYAVVVHSTKRMLIFSTYKALGSKIITTDLSGKNEKVLFKFPDVFDVTGMTVDYDDERIYWVDFTGYGGMIISSRLDGTNKTQHNYRGGSIYWNLATYSGWIYFSDVHRRFSTTGSSQFSVWFTPKDGKQSYRYTLEGKPRGISIYAKNRSGILNKNITNNECDSQKKCHHLCLPQFNGTRECVCSLGYTLSPIRKFCSTNLIYDNFILLVDGGQGKVFQLQIPRKTTNESLPYNILPLGHDRKIDIIAYDPATEFIYWSEKKSKTINKATIDGRNYVKIADFYANSIVIDPQTGYLFYSKNGTIVLSSDDGRKRKTIVDVNTTDIKMIAQDHKNKYLYWTDTFSKEGDGKVMRCKYDGSEREAVLEGLNWPHAITIDHQTNHLYVVEANTQDIYKIDLSDLVTIEDTSPVQDKFTKYEFSTTLFPSSTYLIDFKILDDMAYTLDGKKSRMLRFNLTKGPTSLEELGLKEFYSLKSFSFDSKKSYTSNMKPQNNPCEQMSCSSLCVQLSDVRAKCVCEDGKEEIGNFCTLNRDNLSDVFSDIASFILKEFLKVFRSPQFE